MRKRTVHYRKSVSLPGSEDVGVPACGVSGDVGNFELTTKRPRVTCERCVKSYLWRGNKGR